MLINGKGMIEGDHSSGPRPGHISGTYSFQRVGLFGQRKASACQRMNSSRCNSFTNSNIVGAIEVVKFFLRQISVHRYNDFCLQFDALIDRVENDNVAEILNDVTGFDINFA